MHYFGVVQAHRTHVTNLSTPCYLCDERRFGTVEPPQTHVKQLYTLCYICNDVVREGSRRFDALELHRTSAKSPCTPCFSSKYVDRGGSVVSNQPEPMLKNSTHFARSAMMWFKKVRGGSMRLNYTELVQKHPAHLVSPLNM